MSTLKLGVTGGKKLFALRLRYRYAQHERGFLATFFSSVHPERRREAAESKGTVSTHSFDLDTVLQYH